MLTEKCNSNTNIPCSIRKAGAWARSLPGSTPHQPLLLRLCNLLQAPLSPVVHEAARLTAALRHRELGAAQFRLPSAQQTLQQPCKHCALTSAQPMYAQALLRSFHLYMFTGA